MASYEQILSSQNAGKVSQNVKSYKNKITDYQQKRANIRPIVKENRVINHPEIQTGTSANIYHIDFPESLDFMFDCYLRIKTKAGNANGATYTGSPGANLLKRVRLRCGSSDVMDWSKNSAVYNYNVDKNMSYEKRKQFLDVSGDGLKAGAVEGNEFIVPLFFPFCAWSQRDLKPAKPLKMRGIRINGLQIEITTNPISVYTSGSPTDANIIQSCELCFSTYIVPEDLREQENAKPYNCIGYDYRVRADYSTAANTATEIDLSHLHGSIASIYLNSLKTSDGEDNSNRNPMASIKMEIDGRVYNDVTSANDEKVQRLLQGGGGRDVTEGVNSSIDFEVHSYSDDIEGYINMRDVHKMTATVTSTAASSTDVVAIQHCKFFIENGVLRRQRL